MSAKHTPGPWLASWWYHEETGQGGWEFSAGGYRLPLCDMEMDPAKEDEPEANACLIAAAPDLLEALQKIASRDRHRGSLTLHIEDLCEIDALLSKAIWSEE